MLPGAPDPLQNQKRNGEEIAGELRSTAMLAPTFFRERGQSGSGEIHPSMPRQHELRCLDSPSSPEDWKRMVANPWEL